MDRRALYAFEIFLSRIGPDACRIAAEDAADVAFIDMDNDLGPYLLAGHRMLYPARPLIVTRRAAGAQPDPLTVEVTKPVGLAAFSAALEKARELLPGTTPTCIPTLLDAAAGTGGTLDDMPDEIALETLRDPIPLRQRSDGRPAILHVGSAPDVDLDDPVARDSIYYSPGHFLQGLVARAIAHAREIGRPVRIDGLHGPALILDPREGRAWMVQRPNALRALAQLPARDTLGMTSVDAQAGLPADATLRSLESLEWDLALWASRGRLPRGTHLEHPIRLQRWPNLGRLSIPPEALRIAGLWSRSNPSLRETVDSLDIPQRYVFAFYSACAALGHVEQIIEPTMSPPSPPHAAADLVPQPSAAPSGRNLFGRMVNRLRGSHPG